MQPKRNFNQNFKFVSQKNPTQIQNWPHKIKILGDLNFVKNF